MATTETGHNPNRVYIDRDGNIHLNGSSLYLDESGTAFSGTEAAYTDGITPGTVTASKAVVVDSNKDASALRNLTVTNLDAGASGTAGTVDVFPTTASKGKASISCTDQTGNTTVSLVVGAMAAARTITIPDPLAAANVMLGNQSSTSVTATADGLTTGTIADAGYWQFVTVTSGNADHIVVLPTPTPGKVVVLANGGTGYELRTSTPGSIGINGGTGASAESAITANTLVMMICESATSWKGLQLGSDGTLAKVEVAA